MAGSLIARMLFYILLVSEEGAETERTEKGRRKNGEEESWTCDLERPHVH